MGKWIRRHERNVIMGRKMEEIGNVRRNVQNMMRRDQNVEMER